MNTITIKYFDDPTPEVYQCEEYNLECDYLCIGHTKKNHTIFIPLENIEELEILDDNYTPNLRGKLYG